MSKITLVIFTCEGKEHLLPKTIDSFRQKCSFEFSKTILAIDGQISKSVIDHVKPDVVVQNFKRKGYIFNIMNALQLVNTEYFFWLEDDWLFQKEIKLNEALKVLTAHNNFSQIAFGKLNEIDINFEPLTEDYNLNFLGFTANPSLCRFSSMKEGFEHIKLISKTENIKYQGFETALTEYFSTENITNVIANPNGIAFAIHNGELESTAREFHMINSLDENLSDIGKNYVSGFGADRKITIFNRIKMVFNLCISFMKLLIGLFSSRSSYDYALRIVIASNKGFKH